eukprot:77233_1
MSSTNKQCPLCLHSFPQSVFNDHTQECNQQNQPIENESNKHFIINEQNKGSNPYDSDDDIMNDTQITTLPNPTNVFNVISGVESNHDLINIFIKIIKSKTITLDIKLNDSVLSLKQKIYSQEHIEPNKQKLIYQGIELKDILLLSNYYIERGCTIVLMVTLPKIIIFIKTLTGATVEINVESDDTVQKLKNKIQYKTNILVSHQVLVHEGYKLMDGTKTLTDCNIHHHSELHLVPNNNNGDELENKNENENKNDDEEYEENDDDSGEQLIKILKENKLYEPLYELLDENDIDLDTLKNDIDT